MRNRIAMSLTFSFGLVLATTCFADIDLSPPPPSKGPIPVYSAEKIVLLCNAPSDNCGFKEVSTMGPNGILDPGAYPWDKDSRYVPYGKEGRATEAEINNAPHRVEFYLGENSDPTTPVTCNTTLTATTHYQSSGVGEQIDFNCDGGGTYSFMIDNGKKKPTSVQHTP